MMEICGYFGAVIMGMTLGLLGGGGSILTVPLLVYCFNQPAHLATGLSLFFVGASALFAAITYHRRGFIDYRSGALLAAPAAIGVYAMRRFVLPALPQTIATLGFWSLTKDALIMEVFAAVMLIASISMIKKSNPVDAGARVEGSTNKGNYILLSVQGLAIGAITGFVGAGGGFMIVPALVFLARLEMKTAVGTSLVIIAVNSLFGFIVDIPHLLPIDWSFVALFSVASILGISGGVYLFRIVSSAKLKPAFGYFVMVMGTLILLGQFWGQF